MKKSVGLNAAINGFRTVISLLFPLITYPYITRVLEVDTLGAYNYSYSIISYFYLTAALGVSTYAIREGSKYRDNREKMSKFSSEVFTINIISTLFSYFALFLVLIAFKKLQPYMGIILILSISMIFTTLGCEWIFSIYEEYLYISIRTIIFQIVSLGVLFTFVKTKEDILWYALSIVISSSGSNIVNFIKKRKFCDWRISFSQKINHHIIPILILFANSVATTIYVSADITVLGMLTSDYHVGIYTISSKVYSILKQVLSAIIIVSIPRLSWLLGNHDKEAFLKLASTILNMLICFVLPVATGIWILGKNVILLISTEEFLSALSSLRILCIALVLCLFNWFYTSCILIPSKKENKVLFATVCSALLNLILNFILIPFFNENAAAATTVIAELCSLIICLIASKDIIKIVLKFKDIFSVIVGCIAVGGVCLAMNNMTNSLIINTMICILFSVVIYFIILLLLKNSSIMYIVNSLKNRIKRIV